MQVQRALENENANTANRIENVIMRKDVNDGFNYTDFYLLSVSVVLLGNRGAIILPPNPH